MHVQRAPFFQSASRGLITLRAYHDKGLSRAPWLRFGCQYQREKKTVATATSAVHVHDTDDCLHSVPSGNNCAVFTNKFMEPNSCCSCCCCFEAGRGKSGARWHIGEGQRKLTSSQYSRHLCTPQLLEGNPITWNLQDLNMVLGFSFACK